MNFSNDFSIKLSFELFILILTKFSDPLRANTFGWYLSNLDRFVAFLSPPLPLPPAVPWFFPEAFIRDKTEDVLSFIWANKQIRRTQASFTAMACVLIDYCQQVRFHWDAWRPKNCIAHVKQKQVVYPLWWNHPFDQHTFSEIRIADGDFCWKTSFGQHTSFVAKSQIPQNKSSFSKYTQRHVIKL